MSARASEGMVELPLAAVDGCALDEAAASEQRRRYARLAGSIVSVTRTPELVEVELAAGHDRELLDQALAVERECCPFFSFQLDGGRDRLRVSVDDPARLPALDAIAHMFGAER